MNTPTALVAIILILATLRGWYAWLDHQRTLINDRRQWIETPIEEGAHR